MKAGTEPGGQGRRGSRTSWSSGNKSTASICAHLGSAHGFQLLTATAVLSLQRGIGPRLEWPVCYRAAVSSCCLLSVLCCRCYMHAFGLVLGSVMAHPFARQRIAQAQRVVSYFHASHLPLALLREAAKAAQHHPGPAELWGNTHDLRAAVRGISAGQP